MAALDRVVQENGLSYTECCFERLNGKAMKKEQRQAGRICAQAVTGRSPAASACATLCAAAGRAQYPAPPGRGNALPGLCAQGLKRGNWTGFPVQSG